jgi:hypothetical protein
LPVETKTVRGWRYWILDERGLLKSAHNDMTWAGPTVHADRIPTRDNSHGIYAVATKEQIPPMPSYGGYAFGEVELSGVVVVGEHGYRAETATVRSIHLQKRQDEMPLDGITPPQTYCDWPSEALVNTLEQLYAVEVTILPPIVHTSSEHDYWAELKRAYAAQFGTGMALGQIYPSQVVGGGIGQALMGYYQVPSATTVVVPGKIW